MSQAKAIDKYRHMIPLLSAANFLAALGAGLIIGQAKEFGRPGKVLETFFIGATLGLLLFFYLRSKWASRINLFGAWCSIAGGLLSLVAATVLIAELRFTPREFLTGKTLFVLLSLRFCVWFLARVLRPDIVAGRQQKIAWVELSYYLGLVSGLLATIGIERWITRGPIWIVTAVFIVDGVLQLIAGSVDLMGLRVLSKKSSRPVGTTEVPQPYNVGWYARMVTAVVALTVGTQAVTVALIDVISLPHGAKPHATRLVFTVFYLSVASASIFYGRKKMNLEWPSATQKIARFASIFVGEGAHRVRIPFTLISSIGTAVLALALYLSVSGVRRVTGPSNAKAVMLLLFIAGAAFIYEILALGILDHIGAETKKLNRNGMVALAYCFMGAVFTVTLLLVETHAGCLNPPNQRPLLIETRAPQLDPPDPRPPLIETRIPSKDPADPCPPWGIREYQRAWNIKERIHSRLFWVLFASLIIANLALVWPAGKSKIGAGLRRTKDVTEGE